MMKQKLMFPLPGGDGKESLLSCKKLNEIGKYSFGCKSTTSKSFKELFISLFIFIDIIIFDHIYSDN